MAAAAGAEAAARAVRAAVLAQRNARGVRGSGGDGSGSDPGSGKGSGDGEGSDAVARLVEYVGLFGLDDELVPFTPPSAAGADDVLSLSYRASCLLRVPAKNHSKKNTFPESVGQFVFPIGVQFSVKELPTETHSFVLTKVNGDLTYGICLVHSEKLSQPRFDAVLQLARSRLGDAGERRHWPKELFVPVGLCILSRCEYVGEFSTFLRSFHRELVTSRFQATHLIQAIILLGSAKIAPMTYFNHPQVVIGGAVIRFKPRRTHEFPPLSICAEEALITFCASDILLLVAAILQERQFLFLSKQPCRLLPCIQALLAFIYPFKWAHVFIPVLPLNVLDFLDAPMPFIFGTHPDALRRRAVPDEAILIDIDKGEVTWKGPQIQPFPHRYQRRLTQAFSRLSPPKPMEMQPTLRVTHRTSSLMSTSLTAASCYATSKFDLESDAHLHSWTDEEEDGDDEIPPTARSTLSLPPKKTHRRIASETDVVALSQVDEIRHACLDVFTSLVKTYRLYYGVSENDGLFKCDDYIASFGRDKLEFMSAFVQTQMFSFFVQEREKLVDGGLFDRVLSKKVNKMLTQIADLDMSVRSGFLFKRDKRSGRWKRRWFVLDEGSMTYYKSKSAAASQKAVNPHQQFKINRGTTRIAFFTPEPNRKDKKQWFDNVDPHKKDKKLPTPWYFEVINGEDKLQLCAESKSIRSVWVSTLHAKATGASFLSAMHVAYDWSPASRRALHTSSTEHRDLRAIAFSNVDVVAQKLSAGRGRIRGESIVRVVTRPLPSATAADFSDDLTDELGVSHVPRQEYELWLKPPPPE